MDKIKKIVLFLALILPFNANAASLYFSPTSGSYEVGSVFPVSVYLTSSTESMNAASGVVSFPVENLEVVSLSKTNSIFSLWIKEPSFSNTNGTINFEGIILNSGYTGTSGKILTVNMKAKKAGTINMNFSSASILANDGKGTNITSDIGTAQFTLNDQSLTAEKSAETVAKVAPVTKTPSTPEITSSHPDQTKWYNSNNVKLSWSVPSDITRIRTLLNKNPNSTPTYLYDTSFKEKDFNNLDDGVWYFHIQFRNQLGWGDINHFKIQIDTKNPDLFNITLIKGKDGETSQPVISFKTKDALSGIDCYKVTIGDEAPIVLAKEKMDGGEYTLPEQLPGKKILMVQAFDKAGNYSSTAEEITINHLESPRITEYQKELSTEDFLNIKGASKYPQAQINIYFEKEGKELGVKKTTTDALGNFYLAYEGNLKSGIYTIEAEVVNSDGLRSINNQSVDITVKEPENNKNKILLTKIVIGSTFLILVTILCYIYYRLKSSKKRIKKEVDDVEIKIKESLEFLKKNLDNKIKVMLKNKIEKGLTDKEEETIKKLQKSIDYLEKIMDKEIGDIKKEIK